MRWISPGLQDLLSAGTVLRDGPGHEGQLRDGRRGLLQDGLVPPPGRQTDPVHRISPAGVLADRSLYGDPMRAARHHAGDSRVPRPLRSVHSHIFEAAVCAVRSVLVLPGCGSELRCAVPPLAADAGWRLYVAGHRVGYAEHAAAAVCEW